MLCEGSFPPENPFFSLAPQMRMCYQAIDHDGVTMPGRRAGVTQCCFEMYKHFRRVLY
jgi:hypothetical protein